MASAVPAFDPHPSLPPARGKVQFPPASAPPTGRNIRFFANAAAQRGCGMLMSKIRQALQLLVDAGLSAWQVAAALGISKTTVHARLKAAKLDFETWQTKQGAR